MKKGLLSAGCAALTVWLGLACSGMDMPGAASHDNVASCKAYVDVFNGLECLPESANIKPDDMCPAALDMNPCDMSEYYDCMAENAKCDGKIPDLGGQKDCGIPTCN